MLPLTPCLLSLVLLAGPALLTPSAARGSQVRGQQTPKHEQDSIKVVISEGCVTHGNSSEGEGKAVALAPGSPLVLTHTIKLLPPGSGSCGCEADFAALRERLERLEREVSDLREKCDGAGGSCCTSESKGAGCSIKPGGDECPNECSDQGRCEDGKCVCFPGHSGPDCSESGCPENCSNRGKCVNGQCECDPEFSGPDCSQTACPENCSNRGRCVNGRCECDGDFTGPRCADESCPGNCNRKGRCVNGRCECNPRFTGPDCSQKACPDDCNGRGRCENGECVCDSGFTGANCSETACPGDCNNRGRCVNGQCSCEDGFTGWDCSERTCPNDCSKRGRCVNGRCECSSEFTGPNCSKTACPDDCNGRGNCVDGQCACKDGFTGRDCSETSCPGNCSNNGKCVKGKCVCSVGFIGPKCGTQACPSKCSNRGNCMRGRCMCQPGFAGMDCSQCQKGLTGPNCDTVMSDVSQLKAQNITDTSVTLVWTPPSAQYEAYYITFTSEKEGDQQIALQVEGHLTTFTQTGLAAGQKYRVSIVGELEGRRGIESNTEFMTLISGPTNLRVVKTTSTTAVVQWEPSQGDIDRYRLTISPLDGAGRTREKTVGRGESSALVQQLEAGRVYDIKLVAEKGLSRSQPATTQAVPGKTIPGMTKEALALQVPQAPGEDISSMDQELNQSFKEKQSTTEDGGGADLVGFKSSSDPNRRYSSTIIARTKPLPGQILTGNVTRPKDAERSTSGSRENDEGQGESSMSTDLKAAPPQTVRDHDTSPDKLFSETFDGLNITTKSLLLSKPVNLSADAETVSKQITGGLNPLSSSSVSYSQPSLNSVNSESASHTNSLTPQRRMYHRGNTTRKYRRPQNKTGQQPRTPQDSMLNQTKQESLPSSSPPLAVNEVVKDKIANTRLTTGRRSDGAEHMPKERIRLVFPPPRRPPNPSLTRGQNQTSTNTRVLSLETASPKDVPPHDPKPTREERKGIGTGKSIPNLSSQHITRGNGRPLSLGPNSYRRPLYGRPYQNRTSMRRPHNRPILKSLPTKMPSKTAVSQNKELKKNSTPDNQEREQSLNRSTHGSQKTLSGEKETVPIDENAQIDRDSANTRAQTPEMEREDNSLIDTEKTSEFHFQKEKINTGRDIGEKYKGISSHQTNHSEETIFDPESKKTVGATKKATSAGEPPEFVRVTNQTTDGFTLTVGTPEGKYGNVVVNSTEAKKAEELPRKEAEQDHLTQKPKNSVVVEDNYGGQVTKTLSTSGAKPTESETVQPGSAQMHQFKDLPSQTISTGPEPPTNLAFSKVTENSLRVTWTKPKSRVSGFKVTYTHTDEGEPVSVTLDSGDSSLDLSRLSPGSTYEVTIISTLGLDESDPIRDSAMTLPDPPTDLRAINVTDSTALLVWRPALAPVKEYNIVYGSETESQMRLTVSGNAAEQLLSFLKESTTYTVSITSLLGSRKSSAASTSFTTTTSGRDADGPRDLLATNVTPRTAMLSWKPPSKPVQRYLLTYQTQGQEIKEVIVDAAVTQYNLTRLQPGSLYSVQLIAIRGQHRPSISTTFMTSILKYPHPTDCTQELLNGIQTSGEVEIFPQGKLGPPMRVYCDMETDGGGWMVFQRRKDGSEDFFRGWKDYVKGFGNLNGEFWLGLEKIHNLSTMDKMILRVDLRDGGVSVFAKYSTFEVAKKSYRLKVDGYSGTAGDSLSYHNNQVFSTKDRNPAHSITSCAVSYRGGWWYMNCHEANLNGLYGIDVKHQGIIWTSWKGKDHSIQFTEMKMRPAGFRPPPKK